MNMPAEKPLSYQDRLKRVIPGGAHTYSRGSDQFPANAPQILSAGKGTYVTDDKNRTYLDYGMALRSVAIGYAEDCINQEAIRQIELGNNLTRPSFVELDAAERLVEMIPSVDMVKFTKNGSTAVSAATKLARAYTGKKIILRCADHPFFSFDDWFIGSTVIQRGVPKEVSSLTRTFGYNDIESLRAQIENSDDIACVVIEAATTAHPGPSQLVPDGTFLDDVQYLCNKHNVVFILDEMITGFRWHKQGAQQYYGITPDLCTFGKAMANGFSVAAVAGRREIMELGSIDRAGEERVFLLSTTHGAEMCGLGAYMATMKFMDDNKFIDHLWSYGKSLKDLVNSQAKIHGLEQRIVADGVDCSPFISAKNTDGSASAPLRTLFIQEMLKAGVMMPWISIAYRHDAKELELTKTALEQALPVIKAATESGIDQFLNGEPVKPVFRQFN